MCKRKKGVASRLAAMLLTIIMAVSLMPANVFAVEAQAQDVEFAGGAGTADNPYKIENEAQLRKFADLATADDCNICVVLEKDIELKNDWTAMGSEFISKAYNGTFDGNYCTISGLTVSGSDEQGFFKFIRGGTIKNLTLKGNVTSTNKHAGGIVGCMAFGTIENCSFIGTVTTSISATNGNAGGIVGFEGFSGSASSRSSIINCSNYGTIKGKNAGGITGQVKWGSIMNCYNSGTISGTTRSGGIVGNTQNKSTVSFCYNIGENTGTDETKADIADFVSYSGAAASSVSNCYFRKGYKACVNNDSLSVVTNCEEITDAAALLTKLGNAFATDTNMINGGYPILSWEAGAEPTPKEPKIQINGTKELYEDNMGNHGTSDLSINYIDMGDEKPEVTWTIKSGSDVISLAESETPGVYTVTSKKPGKATVHVETNDKAYSDEAEILVFPHINYVSLDTKPIAGEEYSVTVKTYGVESYDFENYPELNIFTWKYYDSKSDSTNNPSGGTAIQGKGPTITVPANAVGKWLTVSYWFKGENKFASSLEGNGVTIQAKPIPVTGVSITGATQKDGALIAKTGTELTAVPSGAGEAVPTNTSFQWAEKASDGNEFVDIEGATSATYTIPDDKTSLNKEFRVTVSGDSDSTATATVLCNELSDTAKAKETDEGTLNEIKTKYEKMGVLAPEFGKNDNNIAKYLAADIADKGYEGVTVEVKNVEKASYPNGGIAAIANNGEITWFYTRENEDPTVVWTTPYNNTVYARFGVTFTLKKGDAWVEFTKNIDINWDVTKLCDYLKTKILDVIDWNMIKGENISDDLIAKSNLSLPKYPKNVNTKLISMEWTSDNTDAIEIKAPTGNSDTVMYGDRIGKVKRGAEDKTAKLTVTVKYSKTNDVKSTEAEIAKLKKEFTVTVPKLSEDELKKQVTDELNEKLDNAFNNKGLTDYVTGKKIDERNVTGDIQFPTTRDIGIDGYYKPVTIISDNTDVIDYPRDKDDPTKPQNNAARVYVFRPLPGESAKKVKLTMSVKDSDTAVTVSREFTVTVQPLTQKELDDARAFMNKAIAGYWDGLKGTNTDPKNVVSNLTPFQEIRLAKDGSLEYAYDEKDVTGGGIVPVRYAEVLTGPDKEYRRFNLSDNKYINDDTLLLKEDIPEEGAEVKIDSYLNHSVYGEYYTKYKNAGKADAAELFKPFYRQHAETTVVVRGLHTHQLIHFPAKAPTVDSDGNIEYWKCNICGKFFKDPDGKTEISEKDIVIPKLINETKPIQVIKVTSVVVEPTAKTIKAGKTITLKAIVSPADAADRNITWSSSDTKIATVDNNGTVTGIRKGSAVITAMSSNGIKGTCTITVTGTTTFITNATVKGLKTVTYNGKAHTQKVTVKLGKTTLKNGMDYSVSYKNNKNAGVATVIITGKGKYSGTVEKHFTIKKAENTLDVKGKNITIKKASDLAQNSKTYNVKAFLSFKKKGQGEKRYTLKSKKFSIDPETGELTVSKGTKGTHTLKIKVKAEGDNNYKAVTKTVKIKVTVKK